MNLVIKKLAEEAEGTKKHFPGVWQFYDDELKKFAELIVQECAQFVEDKFDFIGEEIIVKEKMLEHFGVE